MGPTLAEVGLIWHVMFIKAQTMQGPIDAILGSRLDDL